MKISLCFVFSSLVVLAVSISLQAQNNSQLAHLSGTLTDSNGGGVGGVQVHATPESTANPQTWSANSSPSGEYVLDLWCVREIDDWGMAMLRAFHETIDSNGGTTILCRIPKSLSHAFADTGLNKTFHTLETRSDANRSFSCSQP